MALYKNSAFLQQHNDPAFGKFHEPGVDAPHPGIYRCKGCWKEIAIAEGNKLPPQNHHQHTPNQGKILGNWWSATPRWELQYEPDKVDG